MKKIIPILFVLFCSAHVSSQISSGKLIYNVDMDRFQKSNEENSNGNSSDNLLAQTAELSKNYQVELLFANDISVFKHQRALTKDGDEFGDLVKDLILNGEYFSNQKDSAQLYISEFQGKVSNVKSKFKKRDWVLSKEQKKIGEFTCYKATFFKDILGEKREIIAWYTPEIPVSLGPKDYVGNLPGMILELDEPLVRFRCSDITLNLKQKVKWPEGIDTISEEEHKKQSKAIWKQIQNHP